ncbi:MAG TPA: AI-2E family transporter [candidate division Zixibacteria bacterium]|nr:AI-2E family transporter [candidate division Zixibacteria bacterium]
MDSLLGALSRHRLAIFVVLVGLLLASIVWTARGALPAFFIGAALAFVLDPVVTFLQRRRVPRWAGVLVSYLVVIGLVWALVAYAVPPIAEQTREFISHLPELGAQLSSFQQAILDWYRSLPLPPDLRAMLDESIANANQAFVDALRGILGPAISTLLRTAAFIVGLVIVPIWLFFVLKDREQLPGAVAGALPETWRPDAHNVMAILARVGGRWVRGQLLLGAAVFVATVIGLTILSFVGFSEFGRFTLVLALMAGVLEWLPNVGPVIAAIPAILIGLSISPAAAVAAAVLYTVIQQLENNLLVPKVLGDAVELHPAVMIFALLVGGALFGLPGAILAAPTVAIGRDLYRYTFERMHDRPPEAAFAAIVERGQRERAASAEAESSTDAEEPPAEAAADADTEADGSADR